MNERPLLFSAGSERLLGVLSLPEHAAPLGVVIVVGGPQYRVGSHRQFVSLARALAGGGFACLRFDYRGMGDSAAPIRGFEAVDEDLHAAIDALFEALPALEGVVLWGLCDGASAALMYAPRDVRVQGVVALNPWVRTEASLASARIKHYYRGRLLSPQFWKRVFGGEVQVWRSLTGLVSAIRTRLPGGVAASQASGVRSFIDRMGDGWRSMRGRTLVVLSGNDLTAREFADFCCARPEWRDAITQGGSFAEIAGADHTLSRREWKHAVEQLTLDWLRGRLAASVSPHRRKVSASPEKFEIQRSA